MSTNVAFHSVGDLTDHHQLSAVVIQLLLKTSYSLLEVAFAKRQIYILIYSMVKVEPASI